MRDQLFSLFPEALKCPVQSHFGSCLIQRRLPRVSEEIVNVEAQVRIALLCDILRPLLPLKFGFDCLGPIQSFRT